MCDHRELVRFALRRTMAENGLLNHKVAILDAGSQYGKVRNSSIALNRAQTHQFRLSHAGH